jgi:hypothetical protein
MEVCLLTTVGIAVAFCNSVPSFGKSDNTCSVLLWTVLPVSLPSAILHSPSQTSLEAPITSFAELEWRRVRVRFIPFGAACLRLFGGFLLEDLFCLLPTLSPPVFVPGSSTVHLSLIELHDREGFSATTVFFVALTTVEEAAAASAVYVDCRVFMFGDLIDHFWKVSFSLGITEPTSYALQ